MQNVNERAVPVFSVEIGGVETTTDFLIIKDPTMTRAPPVAHDGMEAKIGAKKTETKNIKPVTRAVIPVFPPSGENMSASNKKGGGEAIVNNTHPQYRWPIQCTQLPVMFRAENRW